MERSDRYSMLATPSSALALALALAFGTALLPRGEVGPTGAFTPFCKTLDGSAKLAAAPAIFCLDDRQMHAEGRIVI